MNTLYSTTVSLGPISAHVKTEEECVRWVKKFPLVTPSDQEDSLHVEIRGGTQDDFAHISETHTRRIGDNTAIETPFYRGVFSHRTRSAQITLAPVDAVLETQERRVYGVLRLLFSLWVQDQGGAALHGCAIGKSGKAHVFIGKSGAGKTTLVREFPGDVVLGDDLVAILPHEPGNYRVHGTPFSGREGTQASLQVLPLATLSRLTQGKQTQATPISLPDAIQHLLEHMFRFDSSVETRGQALDVASRIGSFTRNFCTSIHLSAEPWGLEALK